MSGESNAIKQDVHAQHIWPDFKSLVFCPNFARLLDWDIKSEILQIHVEKPPSDLFSAGQNMANQCPFEEKTAGFSCDKTKLPTGSLAEIWLVHFECGRPNVQVFSLFSYAGNMLDDFKPDQACLIFMVPYRAAFSRSSTKANEKEQTYNWMLPAFTVTNIVYCLLSRDFTQILSPLFCLSLQKKKKYNASWWRWLYYTHFSTEVTFDYVSICVFVELPLWNRYYNNNRRVVSCSGWIVCCVRKIILLKSWLKLFFNIFKTTMT